MNRSSSFTASELIIHRNGQHISLDNGGHPFQGMLRSRKITTGAHPRHGYLISREFDSLVRPRDGRRRANAGLLPALRYLVRRENLHFTERTDSPILSLPVPVADRRIIDTSLPPFLASQHRGLIRLGNTVGIAEIIAQTVAAFPLCRTTVLSANNAQLDSLARTLRKWLPRNHVFREVPSDDTGSWLSLSTFTEAAVGDFEKCHIVTLLDATQATHQAAEPALATMDARFRLFGLVREDRRLSPLERDVLMATFGPPVLDIPYHGQELAQVNVAWVRVQGPDIVSDSSDPFTLYRKAYWQHPARNRIISRLATAFRTRNATKWRSIPMVEEWMKEHPDRAPRVTVLVENVEHAIALAQQMPGWAIVAGKKYFESVNTIGLAGRKRRLLHERRTVWNTGDQQIVTQLAALSFPLPSTDIIVWAGGGSHGPEIPPKWLLNPTGLNHRVLLIDFQDRQNAQVAKWSFRRHQEYYLKDWFDVGISPVFGRVLRFLFEKPRRSRILGQRRTRQ